MTGQHTAPRTFRWTANAITAALGTPAPPPPADHALAEALHDARPSVLPFSRLPRWVQTGKAEAAAQLHPGLRAAGWAPPAETGRTA